MKKIIILTGLMISSLGFADQSTGIYKSEIKCGETGCSIVCQQPGNRWDTFLQTSGDIEVTHFLMNGTRQLKADVGNGQYTILDTNPNLQSCRITGVVG